jgi:hypothetical protein
MRRIALVASVVLVALVGVVGIAWASIPGADGVIHGCYKNSNPAQGAVIVIDSAASCPSGYTALNWNQTGPTGPPGPSGFQRVLSIQHFEASPSAVGQFFGTVNCPTGMQVVGAGLQEISAEQAWVDAVTGDPNYPDVSAANARVTFYEGTDLHVNDAPGELSANPPTRYGDMAPDGTGWLFNYGLSLPWYDPPGPDNTVYYDADVTVWIACVQP